ncbi:MAG TPA: hypothetical protein VG253_24255 [Streptosporangiaceae bacterium]|jgi:hypothetical protein|nr:hypothetical protein [Streptosporangiaceae bacterium]
MRIGLIGTGQFGFHVVDVGPGTPAYVKPFDADGLEVALAQA